jgi:hypothetical protein
LKKVERLFAFLSYFLLEAVVLDDDEDAAKIWQTIKQDRKFTGRNGSYNIQLNRLGFICSCSDHVYRVSNVNTFIW